MAITPTRAVWAFFEALLTVEVAGLGGIMMHEGQYVWPTWPALTFLTAGAALAAFRRLNALYQTP